MDIERTKDICTPSPRWVPAQERQIKVENLGDACYSQMSEKLKIGGGWVCIPIVVRELRSHNIDHSHSLLSSGFGEAVVKIHVSTTRMGRIKGLCG